MRIRGRRRRGRRDARRDRAIAHHEVLESGQGQLPRWERRVSGCRSTGALRAMPATADEWPVRCPHLSAKVLIALPYNPLRPEDLGERLAVQVTGEPADVEDL